jgi:hypothetical protein
MLNEDIIAIKEMHKEQVLHWRIIYRISILSAYSIGFLGLASYHFFADALPFVTSLVMFAVGFLIGLLFVSQMFGIYWDHDKGMITSGKVDAFGIAMIILYIALRVYLDDALDYVLHPGAVKLSGLAFCLIAGIMVGRFFFTIITVRKMHAEQNMAK